MTMYILCCTSCPPDSCILAYAEKEQGLTGMFCSLHSPFVSKDRGKPAKSPSESVVILEVPEGEECGAVPGHQSVDVEYQQGVVRALHDAHSDRIQSTIAARAELAAAEAEAAVAAALDVTADGDVTP